MKCQDHHHDLYMSTSHKFLSTLKILLLVKTHRFDVVDWNLTGGA